MAKQWQVAGHQAKDHALVLSRRWIRDVSAEFNQFGGRCRLSSARTCDKRHKVCPKINSVLGQLNRISDVAGHPGWMQDIHMDDGEKYPYN